MWGETLYGLLPIPLQNLAVSLKGHSFHADRYRTAYFTETARRLERNEQLSLPDLKELQFSIFCQFAQHAFARSPYYRQLWQSHGLHPNDIREPADVSRVPIVAKQELRSRTREFLTETDLSKLTPSHTSGSTGAPLTVYFSLEDIGQRHAFLERCRRWAGVRIGQKRATFTGRNLIPPRQTKPPFWRYNRPGKQLLFSSYHLLPQNLNAYIAALEQFQPEIIDGYPSAIHIVAEHALRAGITGYVKPGAILVSAETVFPHQRRAIEAAFQAKLYNQYASSEGAPFISECQSGRLHLHLDSGLIEIVDLQGNPVAPGAVGEMVVTSFTTHITPLLRYAIGDTAIPSRENSPCPCGLAFPTVEAIVGRTDDILWSAERGFVGRLDTVFKGVPNTIREAQVVQISPEAIVLNLVPDRPRYKRQHAGQVVEEMRKKLGPSIAIRVEEVESIPRSSNGKMRSVVNLCSDLLPKALRYMESGETTAGAQHAITQEIEPIAESSPG
jgi:phenylacetate-CoA ligase